ncbi:MAG: hypothetical protein JW724_06620 [Candidatus Altiarchaeota archaeon]|nr:hypothetical protein [Candidatus Altiarchaeota archaeon]
MDDTDCFKYYEFQTGLIFDDLMTEKASYSPGESVVTTYTLFSRMKAPIVEGSVRVQIFYNDPDNGEQMIDEFFASRDVSLSYGDSLYQRFAWTLPEGAKSGTYSIKTYFVTGDFFNLAGLSILPYGPPGVPGEMTSFEVKSSAVSRIYFSKKDTYVNNARYEFAAPAPTYEKGTITIRTKLVNEGPAKTVKVLLNTYAWDDLTDDPIDGYAEERTVSLPGGGSGDIMYELSDLDTGTYEIKLIAEDAEGKALLKLRIPVGGPKGRFIYAGIDKFPLVKGEETTFFICYSGSTDYSSSFKGSGSLEIVDDEGNAVFKEDYGPIDVLASPPQGKKVSFTPDRSLNYLTVKADMKDESGTLQDAVSMEYDYSKFADVPADIGIELAEKTLEAGGTLAYTISYADKSGLPLKGKLLIYLIDPEGKIIKTVSGREIIGKTTGSLTVSGKTGEYKVVVRELLQDKKAEETFSLIEKAATQEPVQKPPVKTTPQRESGGTDYLPVIALIAIIAVVALAIRSGKKREVKK